MCFSTHIDHIKHIDHIDHIDLATLKKASFSDYGEARFFYL